MDFSFLSRLVDTSKLAGYVRAGVASIVGAGLTALVAKWPFLEQIGLDPSTRLQIATGVGTLAGTLIVGVWSHFAKKLAAGS